MKRSAISKWLSVLLAFVLVFGVMSPMAVFAQDASAGTVTDYATFLAELKTLETYASAYASTNTANDANELILNFIRTGVEKYTTDTWTTMAGAEITGFTDYVAQQDSANGTTASSLKNLTEFQTPNGQTVEFEHMFGSMNITYLNARSADLGSWAGDLCDLITYTKGKVSGDLETMTEDIRLNYLGKDAENASGFGILDIYGDLDSFYFMEQLSAGAVLSTAMESYYTASLTDNIRAAYFLNNRFGGLSTQEDVRSIIYNTYCADVSIKVLEADNGITSADGEVRTACCYAFADYLFALADGLLEGENEEEEEEAQRFYENFSVTTSTLAPGICQSINYALTTEDEQLAYYALTIDLNREDVAVHANYKDHDPSKGWGMARVPDQMNAAQAYHSDPTSEHYIENFNVIAGVNGDFYNMSTGQPTGALVMDGVEYSTGAGRCFFAILKDGTPVIGGASDWDTYKGNIQEAVGGSAVIVRDGAISTSDNNNRAPRTAVGITANNELVLVVLDGRQEPFSVGTSLLETAQIMLDLGCEIALNLDGGGSSTFASKAEGQDTVSVVSSPSDGYVRSVSSSLVVVSTHLISTEFDHAVISSEYDYLTVGTSLDLTATGVSISGNAAQIPENAQWQVSDPAIGTITDGVFTALSKGDVEISLQVDGVSVGKKALHVVLPDTFTFAEDKYIAIFGVPTEITLLASYNGNPVAFNDNDYLIMVENEAAGTFDGLYFTGNEEVGIRSVLCGAILLENDMVNCLTTIQLYKDGEAVFDFDNVTAGNRTLAWNRKVSNATQDGEDQYNLKDPNAPMVVSYTFGLDLESIEVPEALEDLTVMLPGSDVAGATAWTLLLQLAERVSTLTDVTVTAQLDPNLSLDLSGLTFVNEYFYLRDASVDENNLLTVKLGWYDQTHAIDPATANPVCILSGINATVKEDAQWSSENQLPVVNTGSVSYRIYLRANALYNFAMDEANQAEYSLYPFINPDDSSEKGASFGSTYATFEDSFTLNNTVRQGWINSDNTLSYYVDNVALTGIQMLPGYEDPDQTYLYQFDDTGILIGGYTGLAEMEDGIYYAVQGILMSQWRAVPNGNGGQDYYYFDPVTFRAVDGQQTIDGYTYTFTNHILTKGQIVKDNTGYRYIWAGNFVIGTWLDLDGKAYYATYPKGYFATGMDYVRSPQEESLYRYVFDETGALYQQSGIFDWEDGTYLLDEGRVLDEPGLVYIDGYYYYFCSTGAAVKGRTYWITKTNSLLPQGSYYFDENGRMANPPTVDPEDPEDPDDGTVKDGIVEENGGLFYYVNGVRKYGAGLILLDGNYYYVRSNAQLAVGRYWVTNHNGLLPQGMYSFDTDGKMIDPPVTDDPEEPTQPDETETVKDGIVDENGTLYYYVNGTRGYGAGLILLEGDYYYVRSNAQLAIGDYWVTNHNGLLSQGMYSFGTDGKMIDPPVTDDPEEPTQPEETEPVKDGIVDEDGTLYYYVNGTRGYGAGLILLEGDYYYVRSNAQLAIGDYWVTNDNGLLPQGMYTFGTDGKMIR